jgi:hypothetical protein
MIRIDFSVAIAGYLFLILLLVIGHWIFYNYYRSSHLSNTSRYLKQCPYCTFLFFDYKKASMVTCPQCKSYITQDISRTKERDMKGEKKKMAGRHHKQNESGIVLVTVLMVVIVMIILVVSVMSVNVSEVIVTQRVEDRIKAEQLAKGAFWLNYSNVNSGLPVENPPPVDLDGKSYTATTTLNPDGSGPNSTDPLSTNVAY